MARLRPSRELPPPHEVYGFHDAGRLGLLPQVPAMPPAPLPGTATSVLFYGWVAMFFAFGVVLMFAMDLIPMNGRWVAGLASVAWFAWWMSLSRRIGDRHLAELAAGYTTFEMVFGGFWPLQGRHDWRTQGRMGWDFGTVWVLRARDGSVVRPPSRPGYPPGFYPSPENDGRWELWTGQEWAGIFRERPTWGST